MPDQPINIILIGHDKASGPVGKVNRSLGQLNKQGGLLGRTMGKVGGGIAFVAKRAAAASILLAGGIVAAGVAALKKAGQMERFTAQLEVLLGSSQAAKKRLKELTDFAARTPFELPDVVEASRTLQVFTKGALATGKGLTMVGDIAAGVGRPFQEVAMWVGRLYDAMKSGRPFGEATMRLQEMGAMSGESRKHIEALAAKVKSGSLTMEQAWRGVGGEFSMFAGLMERQSKTLEGQWSNLMDAIGQGFAQVGTAILPLAKQAIPLLINAAVNLANLLTQRIIPAIQQWFRDNRPLIDSIINLAQNALASLGRFLSDIAPAVGTLASKLASLGTKILEAVIPAITGLWQWLTKDGKLQGAINGVLGLLSLLVDGLSALWDAITSKKASGARLALVAFLATVAATKAAGVLLGVADAVKGLGGALIGLRTKAIVPLTAKFALVGLAAGAFGLLIARLTGRMDDLKREFPGLFRDLDQVGRHLRPAAEGFRGVQRSILNLAQAFRNAVEMIGRHLWRAVEIMKNVRDAFRTPLRTMGDLVWHLADRIGNAVRAIREIVGRISGTFWGVARTIGTVARNIRSAIQSIIDKMLALARSVPNISIPGFQHGGFIPPGTIARVGEAGAETVITGRSGALVIPHGRSGGASRGGGSITINFHSTFPPTPSQGQSIARQLIPELKREMRRQGI